MYTIKKISVNSWNSDGNKVYEAELQYKNWRDLVRDYRNHPHYICGRGADVFKAGELIGRTNQLEILALEYGNNIPLHAFIKLSKWLCKRQRHVLALTLNARGK